MFGLRDLFEAILGGEEQKQPQVRPNTYGGSPKTTPSQRDYPGRTNYGVPEDNMIDTRGGYVTPQQYDRGLMFGGFPRSNGRQHEDEGFTGNPRSLNQFSPMNADIKNFQGVNPDFALRMQGGTRGLQRTGQVMDFDSIPNNYTAGRTGYYQGSNPYLQGGNAQDFGNRLRVR